MHSPFLPRASGPRNPPERHILAQIAGPRIEALPHAQWPLAIRAAVKFRQDGDIGIGDTIVHLIGDTRSERFKEWFKKKFGQSCGCTERQRWLNRRFPYQITAS